MGAGHDEGFRLPRADAERGFARGQQLFRRHLDDLGRQTEFELLGRRWTLLPDVFAPTYTPVTELFTAWIPYPVGGTLLEMGSGTGVTAVSAALVGCRRVTALDISSAAVENTRRNVERHGVADRVDVRHSDLFDALSAGERFDVIYWNSNFVEAPQATSSTPATCITRSSIPATRRTAATSCRRHTT